MEFQNFDLKKIKTLNYEEQKSYISKYFIPLTNQLSPVSHRPSYLASHLFASLSPHPCLSARQNSFQNPLSPQTSPQ